MMIEIPLWLLVVTGILVAAGMSAMMFWRRRSKPTSRPLPTEWALTARAVFTTGERRVYRMLKETLPNHVILSKLPLVRFCQPIELGQLRYWYDILGSNYVTFAICAPNGRVLAAIDIDKDRTSESHDHLRRSMKIKRAVLRSCRVRYLRTPAGKLPSAAEIYALLPKTSSGSGTPVSEPLGGPGAVAAAKAAAAQAAAHIARQAVASAATELDAATDTPAQSEPLAREPATEPILSDALYPSDEDSPQTPEAVAAPSTSESVFTDNPADKNPHDEALFRARESLASTVATRRAQRNIMWQESNVFQDSFFALDSRLDDLGEATGPGELDGERPPAPTIEQVINLADSAPVAPSVVKVTLEDMVPSERLGKKLKGDVEEARYAPSGSD